MKIFRAGVKLFHADTDGRTNIMKGVEVCDRFKQEMCDMYKR
jgi:hypothetical protein